MKDIKDAEDFAGKADKESKDATRDEFQAEEKLGSAMKETKEMMKFDKKEGSKAHDDLKRAAKMIIKKKPTVKHESKHAKAKAIKKAISGKIVHELKDLKKVRKNKAEYKVKAEKDADSILKTAFKKGHDDKKSTIKTKVI